MKTLLSTVTLATALFIMPTANSHELSLKNEHSSCSFSVDGNMLVSDQEVTITNTRGGQLRVDQTPTVTLDGNKIDLTKTQQKLFSEYRQEVTAAGHDAKDIAVSALEITKFSLSAVFTDVLALSPEAQQELLEPLALGTEKITNTFYNKDGKFSFKVNTDNQYHSNELEQWGEELVGKIVPAAISALFSSDKSFSEIGRDSARFAAELEQTIEGHGEQLETQVTSLCERLETIDQLEFQMHKDYPELAYFDVVKINHDEHQPRDQKRLK